MEKGARGTGWWGVGWSMMDDKGRGRGTVLLLGGRLGLTTAESVSV